MLGIGIPTVGSPPPGTLTVMVGPEEPPLDPDWPPADWPPDCPELPCVLDCAPPREPPPFDGMLEGIEGMEAPPPELAPPPPDGDGMLGIPPPVRPEEPPPDGLLEPPPLGRPPLDGEEVEGMDDDCCWQPPMRKADTVPIAITCAATTARRLHEY